MKKECPNHIVIPYVNGVPDHSFWGCVSAQGLGYSADVSGVPRETAEVRFAWNACGLFVRAALEDSFVVASDRRNEQLHFVWLRS